MSFSPLRFLHLSPVVSVDFSCNLCILYFPIMLFFFSPAAGAMRRRHEAHLGDDDSLAASAL
jgi:hypothetical protein